MFRDSRWLSWLHQQLSGRPRALQAAIITLAVLLVALTGSFVWFAFDITTGLPDKNADSRAGRYGAGDDNLRRQRPSGLHDLQGAAHRGPARQDVAEPDQGGDRRSRISGSTITAASMPCASRRRRCANLAAGPSRRGRQHHHAAARAPELPHPRQDVPPQAEGDHPRRAHRAHVLEEGDPRAVPEQGVLRRRAVRRRGRIARLFRQARQRARR